MPGLYYVNANVAGLSEDTSHSLMQGAVFTVRGAQPTVGPVAGTITMH